MLPWTWISFAWLLFSAPCCLLGSR
jgi:hypothetical protein